MKIVEIAAHEVARPKGAAPAHYDPSARYLHGGPKQLEGDRLKRYGKDGHDMGALFFCKDTPVGRYYAGTYGEQVWICSLKPPAEKIFDLTNPSHRRLIRQHDPQLFKTMMESSRSGHLDWTSVDDELFSELGFQGMVFLERPKGMQTGFPPQSGFAVLPEDILSVGIFDPQDAQIIGSSTRDELWREAGII